MFNKVICAGHLTRNPELRYSPNGTPIATFGLACNRRFKQGDELKEEVMFIDVTVFGKQAESASTYLFKGSSVIIDGRLQQRRWESEDGKKHSKHEIVAEHVTFMGKKNSSDEGQGQQHHEYDAQS
jgi:single-strand DNA-binding protein